MHDLNNRIYHQEVPKPENLVFEKNNMMSAILPNDLFINENKDKIKTEENIYCPDLDLLNAKK